jgi:hypothetical protein
MKLKELSFVHQILLVDWSIQVEKAHLKKLSLLLILI